MNVEALLEKLARKYDRGIREWKRDPANAFKDGHLLGLYEGKEAILSNIDREDGPGRVREALRALYAKARRDWERDRRNPFKDGRLLASYELMQMATV